MNNEYRSDLLVRYNYMFRKRYTYKQKNKFINALLLELSMLKKDASIVESYLSNNKKSASRNIYVGNVKKAKKIIATYYDTSATYFGSYEYDSYERQCNRILLFNICLSIFVIIIGILFTVFYAIPHLKYNSGLNLDLFSIICIYFVIFYCIGKFAKGTASSKTLIRNTSSIIWMIERMTESNETDTAYAFLDNGTTNEQGLASLLQLVDKKAEIYYLDSIGADAPLWIQNGDVIVEFAERWSRVNSNARVFKIFAAYKNQNGFVLGRNQLNMKSFNENNFQILNTKI